jgi:hypothetical protein
VFFIGGANDDFLTGVTDGAHVCRRSPGPAAWSRNQASAAAASLAKIGEQTASSRAWCGAVVAVRTFLLHDFLVTDLVDGRTRDRAAMLSARRDAVLAEGGKFVDLLDAFEDRLEFRGSTTWCIFRSSGTVGSRTELAARFMAETAVRKNGGFDDRRHQPW